MENINLKEMQSDINALEKIVADWRQSLSSFDQDWENVVKLHEQQRMSIVSQIEKNEKTLSTLQEKYDMLKNSLIVADDENECPFVEIINEYYRHYGMNETLEGIILLVALKRGMYAEEMGLEEIKDFLGNQCGCNEYKLIADFLDL